MRHILHCLSRASLEQLDRSTQSPVPSGAERRHAQLCLNALEPVQTLVERHDRVLGVAGFGMFCLAVLSVFVALASADLQAAAGAALAVSVASLTGLSVFTQRVGSAVEMAREVLALRVSVTG